MLTFILKVMDSDGGGAVNSNPTIVYVVVKHNLNNIGTAGSNTPGTTIIQPQQQQQQPITPNNNAISPPSQPNSPSTSPTPQIESLLHPISSSDPVPSGTAPFAGSAVAFHTLSGAKFTVTYTVDATANTPTKVK